MLTLAAINSYDVASYIDSLITVYTALIFIYILLDIFQSFGAKIPYNRFTATSQQMLRQLCEPYLALFRRFIPPLGPIDITPIVALFTLQIVGMIVTSLIVA